MLDLNYPSLVDLIKPYKVPGRTESTSFLHWFLVNIYRLERMDVDNIVCDGRGDKGIDGIYVNENEEYIDVFQSKIVQNTSKTLGDTQLKEFIGSLEQLRTQEGFQSLIQTCNDNPQLENLLIENKDKFLSCDYSIRGIFITNASKDANANNLLQTITIPRLEVWDKLKISQMYVSSEKAIRATSVLTFDVFGLDYVEYKVENVAKVVVAPISATDLVEMEGIQNQQIFDLNLRKSLGKTKVNKDIYKSIEDQSKHDKFLLYHNGITIICSTLDTSVEGQIKIKDYAVVNGCQSVSCLYAKRNKVTKDLKILTRIIEIQPDSGLIDDITYNSNNQNGIRVRDFRSNTPTQVRIQKEIEENYPSYFYQIKTGEECSKERTVIDNQLAGRILLVFDLQEPWAVQGITKIFEDSHSRIFARPEVKGARIVSLFKLYTEVEKDVDKIKPELFQGYQITKFMLFHLLSEVLLQDEIGKQFKRSPETFFETSIEEQKLFECVHTILGDLIIDLNAEFKEGGSEQFDFKKVYKSSNELPKLTNEVLKAYQKLIQRGRVESFSQLWESKHK